MATPRRRGLADRIRENGREQRRNLDKAVIQLEEIARNVHAHPTLSETLMEAAHGAEGETINI